MDRREVSASEVADYAFCARSWWLKRVKGVRAVSESIDEGVRAHDAAGARVQKAEWADRLTQLLIVAAAAVAAAWMIGALDSW